MGERRGRNYSCYYEDFYSTLESKGMGECGVVEMHEGCVQMVKGGYFNTYRKKKWKL